MGQHVVQLGGHSCCGKLDGNGGVESRANARVRNAGAAPRRGARRRRERTAGYAAGGQLYTNYFGQTPDNKLRTVYCNSRMVADYGFIPAAASGIGDCYKIRVSTRTSARRVEAHLRDDNLAPAEVLAALRDGSFRAGADPTRAGAAAGAVAPPCEGAFDAAVRRGPATLQNELMTSRSWRLWLIAEPDKLADRHGQARARLGELARASEAARRFVEESRVVRDVLKVAEGERRIIDRAIAHVERRWSELLTTDAGWEKRRESMQPVTTGDGRSECAFVSGADPEEAEEK